MIARRYNYSWWYVALCGVQHAFTRRHLRRCPLRRLRGL
jgi:hypothetical protein